MCYSDQSAADEAKGRREVSQSTTKQSHRSRTESRQSEFSDHDSNPQNRAANSPCNETEGDTRAGVQKPKVSRTRLSYIVSSDGVGNPNLGTPTSFTLEDLDQMAELYPWPKGVTLCLPVEGGGSLAKYPNSLVVHEESLKAGFRLPIPSFSRDLLRWTELCPAQFNPNSWRLISAYGIRCWEVNLEPTFRGMQSLFEMREVGEVFVLSTREIDLVLNPRDVCNWKRKWFLVKKGDGFDFDFPIHPGRGLTINPDRGVKCKKGSDAKELSSEAKELKDALQSFGEGKINLKYSELITWENLEKAGLSLPCPTTRFAAMKPGESLLKSPIKEQCRGPDPPPSRSEGASKKQTMGSRPPPGEGEEKPMKKRVETQLPKSEPIDFTSVCPSLKSPTHQPMSASSRRASSTTEAPHVPERRHGPPPPLPHQHDYLVSKPSLEEANGLLKGAAVNVNAVSTLGRLSDEQVTAEFARATALQVYHANNLIKKHEKLLSSHMVSLAKLEELKEQFREVEGVKQELSCAKKSAKQNEESLKKEIQSLKYDLKKTQEEKASLGFQARGIRKANEKLQRQVEEQHKKIQELERDLSRLEAKGHLLGYYT